MKKLFRTVVGVLTFALLVVSCTKNESNSPIIPLTNAISYNNATYNLDKGFLENYGNPQNLGYNIDLTLLSSGLIVYESNGLIDSISGTGSGIYFEIYSSNATGLDVRDYTFDAGKSGAAGTFDYANTILNFNILTQQGIDLDLNGGKITVKKSGAEYELAFECTGVNGKSITGYYKGSLKYYNNSGTTKSARIKKLRRW